MPSQVSPGVSHRRFGVSHVNGVPITRGLPNLRIFVTNFRKFFRAGLLGERGWVGEGSTRGSCQERRLRSWLMASRRPQPVTLLPFPATAFQLSSIDWQRNHEVI